MNFVKKVLSKENILFVIYVIITTVISSYHENWFDEGQAWQIAKYNSLVSLFEALKYEGHPCLWYIIIMPFAKLGFSFKTINVICIVSMWCTSFLIIYKSNFRFITKIAILSTFPYIYVYPTIARSYSLIPLFLAILAIYSKDRKSKIIYAITLALFANLHAFTLAISSIIALEFFVRNILLEKDNKIRNKNWIYILIIAIGILFSVFTLYGSTEKCGIVYRENFSVSQIIEKIKEYFRIISSDYIGNKLIVFVPLIIILCVIIFRYDKFGLLIITSLVAISVYTYIYLVYWIQYEKISIYLVLLIFVAWRIRDKNLNNDHKIWFKKGLVIDILIFLICICNFELSCKLIQNDMDTKYSESKDAADEIKKQLPQNSIIISGVHDASIQAYLNDDKYIFINLKSGNVEKYSIWKKGEFEPKTDYDLLLEKCREYKKMGKRVYVLIMLYDELKIALDIINNEKFCYIYGGFGNIEDKIYYIYEFDE